MTIRIHSQLLDLSSPKVMGILNVTPDSFYDGGKWDDTARILQQVDLMVAEGVDIIDIGGMSSRPGSSMVDINEELRRVIDPITQIHARYPHIPISIDTLHARVARETIAAGATIVNDISAGTHDPDMIATVASLAVPYLIMHMQGSPATMQLAPCYDDVALEVFQYLQARVAICRAAGVHDVVIDPGFGFGKTVEHNYTLLRKLPLFYPLDCPILVGLSRKSMVTRVLDVAPVDTLNGTTVLHTLALMHGAHILRVHDVKAAREAISLVKIYEKS
jgi:dihydropteroate synthase